MATRNGKVLPEHFAELYRRFQANITKWDCGKKCAPLNNGYPLCCSTQHAVPVMHRAEYQLLKSRTQLWQDFKPYDAATRKIKADLHSSCTAVECKGPCERENRSLACRAFPFFPYFGKDKAFLGLATYWTFEDRCWMMSHLELVEPDYVRQFVDSYEYLFSVDRREHETYIEFSATMRRVFSRRRKPFYLIDRTGHGYLKVLPAGRGIRPVAADDLPRHPPFNSLRAYARAVKEEGGSMPRAGLAPE